MKRYLLLLLFAFSLVSLSAQSDNYATVYGKATPNISIDLYLVVWHGEYDTNGEMVLYLEELDYADTDGSGNFVFYELDVGLYELYYGDTPFCSFEILEEDLGSEKVLDESEYY